LERCNFPQNLSTDEVEIISEIGVNGKELFWVEMGGVGDRRKPSGDSSDKLARFQAGLTFLTCLCFANSSTVSLFIKTHIE
jgi:hypothetical protein